MPGDRVPEDRAPEDRARGAGRDPARLAAQALGRAKAAARARGFAPLPGPLARRAGEAVDDGLPAAAPGRPASPAPGQPVAERPARARRDDPQPLRAAISALLGDQGWHTAVAVGSVFGRWDEIVGPDLAAHTRPESFADGEVLVAADSTAWATQVRLLAPALVRRLNEELGNGAVRRVSVRGPAPPRRSGPWRVSGGRGPRGDYG